MYKLEAEMYYQLCILRDNYGLQGIKAGYETEGASFRDLYRLRRITSKAGVKLYLKIGGVKAIRDIKDSLEVGVDGLIAPMAESIFATKKFYEAYKKVYGDYSIHTTLTLETKNAIEVLDSILEYASGKIDNITIGRTDLSGSYLNTEITPDSDYILKLLDRVGKKVKQQGLTYAVGGSVSAKTISKINEKFPDLKQIIHKLETRKVILPADVFLESENALKEALKFEELYILSKKEFSDMFIASEITRLTELQRRK